MKNLDILILQTYTKLFLKAEILLSQNQWFCPSSNVISAPILIIQLCRFSNQGGQLMKDENFFSCTQSESNKHPTVTITVEDEVSFTNKYSLITTINHSCTLNRGQSWAFTYIHVLDTLEIKSWFLMFKKIL